MRYAQRGDRINLPDHGWGVIHNLSIDSYGMIEWVEVELDSGKWVRVEPMPAHAEISLTEIILH